MQEKLVFLISTPRSGSTLLMRMLNATSSIYSRPEPHMIPALAHLGYWDTVDKAPYDQLQAQQAMRSLLLEVPNGEESYFTACRSYTDHLYAEMLALSENKERYFLDKTPANALVLPFLSKLYPQAHYLLLTRHPAAIFSSYANSFFAGDYKAAVDFNPILSRYIPAMADFLRNTECPLYHLSYEDLAAFPEEKLREISDFLEVPFEADAVNYQRAQVADGLGDPIGVQQHNRPVTSSIEKWAAELAASAEKFEIISKQLRTVPPEDLQLLGYPVDSLWKPMEQADPKNYQTRKKQWNQFSLQRRALVSLRRDIHRKPIGRLVKKIRFYCDVLLRG